MAAIPTERDLRDPIVQENAARTIQGFQRSQLRRKKRNRAALAIQRVHRGKIARRELLEKKKAATSIQANIRGRSERGSQSGPTSYTNRKQMREQAERDKKAEQIAAREIAELQAEIDKQEALVRGGAIGALGALGASEGRRSLGPRANSTATINVNTLGASDGAAVPEEEKLEAGLAASERASPAGGAAGPEFKRAYSTLPAARSTSTWKPDLQKFLDEPSSSRGAQVFALVMLTTIVASAVVLCLSTLPRYRTYSYGGDSGLVIGDDLAVVEHHSATPSLTPSARNNSDLAWNGTYEHRTRSEDMSANKFEPFEWVFNSIFTVRLSRRTGRLACRQPMPPPCAPRCACATTAASPYTRE